MAPLVPLPAMLPRPGPPRAGMPAPGTGDGDGDRHRGLLSLPDWYRRVFLPDWYRRARSMRRPASAKSDKASQLERPGPGGVIGRAETPTDVVVHHTNVLHERVHA